MNQFFYQITRKASDLINSDDYRERNITRQTAFTRNRKLSFPVMIVLLLNFLTRTMQIELDDFFANVLDAGTDSVTKQAFFKARKNILPDAFKELFLMTRDMVLNKNKIKRHKGYRILATCKLVRESDVKIETVAEQISLFDDPVEKEKKEQAEKKALEQEKQMQKTIIGIKKRFGKNAILKGMNFQESCDSNYYSEERIYDGFLSVVNKLRFGQENILGQVIAKLESAAQKYRKVVK